MSGLLSVIIPAYNEEENILAAAEAVLAVVDSAKIESELVFVSDGSRDKTFEKIEEAAKKDSRIRGIEFSRNFGKEAAILAGLREGKGDCFVVMDCDLQHPPETIVKMYKLWTEGYEVVEGVKNSRGTESVVYKKLSGLFYSILSKLTGFDMKNTSDFKLVDRRVADILSRMPERKTFFRALTFWTGFKSCNVYYDVNERKGGSSKWSAKSLIGYAITNIVSFSSVPLNMVAYAGFISLFSGFVLGIVSLIRLIADMSVGTAAVLAILILIIGGLVLVGMGLVGRYIAAIYDEIKHRPRYIIMRDTHNGGNGGRE